MKPSNKVACFPSGPKNLHYAELFDPAKDCRPAFVEFIVDETAIKANCDKCGKPYREHGYCELLQARKLVCPGNVLVTAPDGTCEQVLGSAFFEKYNMMLQRPAGPTWR